ncbi:MAG: hypothetical protein ACP5MV_03965 [Candidatus Parvarchaeum sp.]
MEIKLDLILLEELTRKYGKVESDSSPGKEGSFNANSYSLDLSNGKNKLEVHLHEYQIGNKSGNSKVINLNLYAKSGLFYDYRKILSYTRGSNDEKKLILLTGNKYRENKTYTEGDSTFIEMKYTKNVKTAIAALKNFAYNKEGLESLVPISEV